MKKKVEQRNPVIINGVKFWFNKIPNTTLPFPTFSETSQERLVHNKLYDLNNKSMISGK